MLYTETFPRRAPTEVLWGQTAPAEHAVQIYADQGLFLDALEGFASSGLRNGEAVIIIATEPHRRALARRLRTRGFDLDQARADDLYLPLDAAGALSQFMVEGWPDEARFESMLAELLRRARGSSDRPVRAFGEMVVLLWSQNSPRATVRLEHMWNNLCETESFSLFCAYPRAAFGADPASSIVEVCSHHSRIIPE